MGCLDILIEIVVFPIVMWGIIGTLEFVGGGTFFGPYTWTGIPCAMLTLVAYVWIFLKDDDKTLRQQINREEDERRIASAEGLGKTREIEKIDYEKDEGMAKIFLYQANAALHPDLEEEKGWITRTAIADGIGGPGAAAAEYAEIARENAKIRARNAERLAQAPATAAMWEDMAKTVRGMLKNRSSTFDDLARKYEAVMSWSPKTLISFLNFYNVSFELSDKTRAIIVKAPWVQSDQSICIDGALRGKIYTKRGRCVGSANLAFPATGTLGFRGELQGVCAQPKVFTRRFKSYNSYTIILEPINLWELAPRGSNMTNKTDGLTLEEHRAIVAQYRTDYENELG